MVRLLVGGGVMSGTVKVDPVDLRMSANHLAMHSEDLKTAHAESDADIEATQAGWVGESAMAMQAKLTEWQQFTTRICVDLDTHQDNFRSAADAYEGADVDGATSVSHAID